MLVRLGSCDSESGNLVNWVRVRRSPSCAPLPLPCSVHRLACTTCTVHAAHSLTGERCNLCLHSEGPMPIRPSPAAGVPLAILTVLAACQVDDVVLPDSPDDVGVDVDAQDVSADTPIDSVDDPSADADPNDPCDLTGTWAGRTTAYALDTLIFAPQLSSIWYYWEFEDYGDAIEIVGGFNCGIRVEGSASVTLTAAATEALRVRNSPIGRRGTFLPDGDSCAFRLERTYLLRGGDPALLPENFADYGGPDALERLDADIPLPTPENPDLADDIDEDGEPGIAFQVGGAVAGARNVVQRDWNDIFSSDEYPVAQGRLDEFRVDFDYDVSESLMSITGCDGFGCGLLEAGSAPDPEGDHHTQFVRVNPAEIEGETDLETCFNVQDLLPYVEP